MGTVNLDQLGAKVKVKWKEKEYLLRKFTVEEQPELEQFRNITDDNALELAQEGVAIIAKRFVEADETFDVESFKNECTFEMLNAVVEALIGRTRAGR